MKNSMTMTDFDNLVSRVAIIIGGTVSPRTVGGESPDHFDYAWPRAEIVIKDITWIVHNQYPYNKITFVVKHGTMPKYFNLETPSFNSAVTTSPLRMAQNIGKLTPIAEEYLKALNARLDIESGQKNAKDVTKSLSASLGIPFSEYSENRTSGTINEHYVVIDLREVGGVSRFQVDDLTDEQFKKLMEVLKNL